MTSTPSTISDYFRGQKVIITGGVGSVGGELFRKLLEMDVKRIRVIDNNESGLFDMEQRYGADPRAEFYLCDITDEREMRRTFSDMDLCFHAAALKHVPSCERSPFAAVRSNIEGSEIVGRVALENGLRKVVFTSSDKAVNPTNVMGTSKLMGERLFTAMNFLRAPRNNTLFSSTRFGNVLGSRGSVVPIFCKQIAAGQPVTITDMQMTRFVMTLSEAADLVIESMYHMIGGEVFITKMPVLRIHDLAQVMINLLAPLYDRDPADIPLQVVGSRPGEKLWEELSTDEEAGRLRESGEFLIVLPAGKSAQTQAQYDYPTLPLKVSNRVYHSDRETVMTHSEIADLLMKPGVLPDHLGAQLRAMQPEEVRRCAS